MHLALFLSGLAGGGAQRRMLTLARGFAERGHDLDLVVAQDDGPFRALVPASANLVALDSRPARWPGIRGRRALRVTAATVALAAYLRDAGPDLLLSTSNAANFAALSAGALSRAGVPIATCVNIHLSAATERLRAPWRALLRRLLGRLYGAADLVIANSRGIAADMATLGVAPDRIVTICNPVDIDGVRRQAAAQPVPPWPGPANLPVILAVGKLKRQKDFRTLIKAFARLRARRPARLVILGEGEQRDRLLALAHELGVAADIYLPGFVDNPFPWMARASVFVLSSAWEGFSNALLEALACGCPVVSTDCDSGPREILQDGAYGRLVPVGADALLAEAIIEVLDAPPRPEWQRAGAAVFAVDAAVDRYLDVLAGVGNATKPETPLIVPSAPLVDAEYRGNASGIECGPIR